LQKLIEHGSRQVSVIAVFSSDDAAVCEQPMGGVSVAETYSVSAVAVVAIYSASVVVEETGSISEVVAESEAVVAESELEMVTLSIVSTPALGGVVGTAEVSINLICAYLYCSILTCSTGSTGIIIIVI
jgi:hypothetical protein